jgi:hypothetical protein
MGFDKQVRDPICGGDEARRLTNRAKPPFAKL